MIYLSSPSSIIPRAGHVPANAGRITQLIRPALRCPRHRFRRARVQRLYRGDVSDFAVWLGKLEEPAVLADNRQSLILCPDYRGMVSHSATPLQHANLLEQPDYHHQHNQKNDDLLEWTAEW
jgi:hypothetical protein